ncbi:MAG: hypothetical protein EXR98_12990 [Gemmataceae bacterium]|nr:hypothetical protein [Gemmataceae bacterium]
MPPEIKKIQVGFQSYQREDQTAFKVGLWAPVYVEVFGGTEGIMPGPKSYLEIQTNDSEDVGTRIMIGVALKAMESRTFLAYVKTGHMGGSNEVQVRLNVNNREYKGPSDNYWSMQPNAHLYLTLGQRMPDVHRAARKIGRNPNVNEKELPDNSFDQARQVVFETDVKRLPEAWFGYNGVDLMILSTENTEFLKALINSPDRLSAVAKWVRRGGRLVIPIAHSRQPFVHALLQAEAAWQPPIPVVPPKSPGNTQELAVLGLPSVQRWGKVQEAFQRLDSNTLRPVPMEIALLEAPKNQAAEWEVFAAADDGRAVIARVRYGLGQITYIAFSFDDPGFRDWGNNKSGRDQFLQTMLKTLAPRAPDNLADFNQFGGFNKGDSSGDLTTELIAKLDNFDVTIIPFGYVALFIVLYILVVGPLDFFLLKFVFKRLEWTWITFPAVVLGVSVIAYFAAYALKGRDLKINKVDVVDFDLRTSRDGKQVLAYGQSFFTILSPRIQNYTVGLEPNPEFWGEKADKVRSVDLMSWLGRPSGGPHDMRRSGSSGFFRKPYEYSDDVTGLRGVPIPVWTTKAFSASWEQPVNSAPFTAELVYHKKPVAGKDLKITGKLESHLGVDLIDVWLIYQDRCYAIPGGLKSVKKGEAVKKEFSFPSQPGEVGVEISAWVNRADPDEAAPDARAWNFNLLPVVKKMLFHERFDIKNDVRNHSFRTLDLGWRVTEELFEQPATTGTREAILVGRTRAAAGRAEELSQDATKPLATKLWLGDLPDAWRSRPSLVGHMNQETFIRVILPVRPADE